MLNQRGQEEAPFELLVAVIIMGFVIFVGMQAMEQLRVQKCQGEVNAVLNDFKVALEEAAKPGGSKLVNFNPQRCADTRNETIKITTIDDAEACTRLCTTSILKCMLLEYALPNFYVKRVCLNISPNTVFPSQDSISVGGTCGNKSTESPARVLRNLGEGIERGEYLLINATSSIASFQTICAYMRS